MALAVEPIKGLVKLFNPFTRTHFANLTQNLDLTRFRCTQLTTAYHVVADDHDDLDIFSNSCCPYIKVLICYKRSIPPFRHCSMLTLSDGGRMHKSKPFTKYKTHDKPSCRDADDVVRYMGITYALDDERLVVVNSLSSEKLFMIVPVDREGRYLHFKVYELIIEVTNEVHEDGEDEEDGDDDEDGEEGKNGEDEEDGEEGDVEDEEDGEDEEDVEDEEDGERHSRQRFSRYWSEVTSFGDADQVLFISRDYCFFVAAGEFPGCKLRDCIVFSDDAFPRYSESKSKPAGWNYERKVGNDVAVYSLGGQGSSCSISVGCYPGFPAMLWSPPPSILHNASSSLQSQSHSQSEFEEVEMIHQSDSNKEDSQAEESESEDVSPNAAGALTTSFLAVNDVEHANVEASHSGASKMICTNTQTTHSITRAYITSITQSNQSDTATVKFEGLEIRSTLLLTLQKVWSKHGNLIENITFRNGDIISRALEALATTVLILEENSARTLSDSQADYLSSTLSDLRRMQFKVDWLVPYVEKAVELHKSKPLLDSRDKLGHCKAQVAEKISRTLDELAALDKLADELDEEIASVSKVIPFSGNVDLDKLLGGGLS